MIQYEKSESSVYAKNQAFCENIEKNLKAHGCQIDGFCNAFGYEINAKYMLGELEFDLFFTKQQTTRNSVAISSDAGEYEGLNINGKGFRKSYFIEYGRSKVRRLFTESRLKKHVPSPFFLSTDISQESSVLSAIKFLKEFNVDEFDLKAGKMSLRIRNVEVDVIGLIEEIVSAIAPKI